MPFTIPDFTGTVTYESYSDVEDRIARFDDWFTIGKDQTGRYNIYCIRLGNSSKPPILINASMHGSEWQGLQYSLSFFENIRDNTFPDVDFRNELLENFQVFYIPALNPWGYDNAPNGPNGIYSGASLAYQNGNGVSFNADGINFTQSESRAIRDLGYNILPFAYLDIHLYQPFYSPARGNNTIIGNGQPEINHYINDWLLSQENYTGMDVTRWSNPPSNNSTLMRSHFDRLVNPYTPTTVSVITEIVRPTMQDYGIERRLTDEQIYSFGNASLFGFLYTAMTYFNDGHFSGYKDYDLIETPLSDIKIFRDYRGLTNEVVEEKEGYNLVTLFDRDGFGRVMEYTTRKE